MYILNPSILGNTPHNQFFHITHLMEVLQKSGKRVSAHPMSEKSYIDFGQWKDYKDVLERIKL